MDHPAYSAGSHLSTTELPRERRLGIPPHDRHGAVHRHRGLDRASDGPTIVFATLLAIEDGRLEVVRASRGEALAYRDSLLGAGDTLSAGTVDGEVRTLDGFLALQRGELDRAVELLIEGQRAGTGWGPVDAVNASVRWTIGELLVELDRPEEAIPYFRSFRIDPYASIELGKIYQGLGRTEEAKERYETALAYWRNADPELAPRIADVRQRLAGLGFRTRD